MGAQPAAPILLPRHGPQSPFDVFVYTAEPGDILFFPESHAHIVQTWDGPNLMVYCIIILLIKLYFAIYKVNYRKLHLSNILHQPLIWATSMLNMKLFPQQVYFFYSFFLMSYIYKVHNAGKVGGKALQDESVPEKKINKYFLICSNRCC